MNTKIAKGPDGAPMTYFRVAFEPEEVRYLGSHLQGAIPKLVHMGTIGEGLIVFFEGKGTGMRHREGKLEALINAAFVCGFQGERPPIEVTYDRNTHQGKPAFYLHPIKNYDRDADEVEVKAAAEELFNPAIPALNVTAPPATAKPVLSRRQVAEIAARHEKPSAPPIAADRPPPADKGGHEAPRPSAATTTPMTPAQVAAAQITATNGNGHAAIPKRPSTESSVRDIRDLAVMFNETMDRSDDLLVRVVDEGRHIQVVRRRVVEEALL